MHLRRRLRAAIVDAGQAVTHSMTSTSAPLAARPLRRPRSYPAVGQLESWRASLRRLLGLPAPDVAALSSTRTPRASGRPPWPTRIQLLAAQRAAQSPHLFNSQLLRSPLDDPDSHEG